MTESRHTFPFITPLSDEKVIPLNAEFFNKLSSDLVILLFSGTSIESESCFHTDEFPPNTSISNGKSLGLLSDKTVFIVIVFSPIVLYPVLK